MSFKNLGLCDQLLRAIKEQGYDEPTPVQKEAIPVILKKRDILAGAQTGTGKTAGFTLPMLQLLHEHKDDKRKRHQVRALILTPTRELASQVQESVELYGKFLPFKSCVIFGGVKINPQITALSKGMDIVVATPGRLLDHISQKTIDLSKVDFLILDEADRMLDMGFSEEINEVLEFAPKERQTLLFSATYTDEILDISATLQKDAVNIKTTSTETTNKITEYFYEVEHGQKLNTLVNIFTNFKPENVIVFCNTKIEADEIANSLQKKNIDALAIHGDLEQYERNDVLVQFANKSATVLVATDVAARGLDIKELSMVVNYDIPHGEETYTHRIGRTGRAGAEGLAFTLYEANEVRNADEYKNETRIFEDGTSLKVVYGFDMKPANVTLVIEGGKKDKVRAGDLLGALTGDAGLQGSSIGKIDIYERQSYVAIENSKIDEAHDKLKNGKIKGKKFSVWIL